ncbi:arginase family protein [Ochrobactrum sp. Marseille-Q0166]|uniref:arginase family protein n=1 Tax=Ochrobactrum sp. Marseille-Q0166 TaxID=2761105 RepID=UPI00165628A1|nr:arginase family protein [Ochrobactrum sp. Marseille-Q0166]MBC8718340.1 arginase family protein [Ochrobactrum sp. Marseille-Q0166]
MKHSLIVSQGRVADRTGGAIPGALALANSLAARYGFEIQTAGKPSSAKNDHWKDALLEAEQTLTQLATAVSAEFEAGRRPILVTNTCSASLATIPQAVRYIDDLVVLWIDAHGDFNTPATTASGYLGGMALAGICGIWDTGHGAGLASERAIIVGGRDIDPEEQLALDKAGVQVVRPANVTAETILKAIKGRPVWIHIDWDVMEPGLIPAAYAIDDGLNVIQLRSILAAIPESQIVGIELAEFEMPEAQQDAENALALIREATAPLFKNV